MTKLKEVTFPGIGYEDSDVEEIDIDYILHDVMIIKAESLKDRKIFNYAAYLEKQLLKIKNKEAILDLGVPLK